MTQKNKVKLNIMNHVSILDLVNIHVLRIPNTAMFEINIESLDKDKQFVIDPDALRILNQKLTEKVSVLEVNDPKARYYMEEFTAKMISELHKNGLAMLEDIPDAPKDPYAEVKKQHPIK